MAKIATAESIPAFRSAERAHLAEAIARKQAISDHLDSLTAALAVTFVSDALDKVEAAEKAAAKARKIEPHRLAAELTGDNTTDFGPSVQSAEFLLEDARADLVRAQQMRAILEKQQRSVEQDLQSAAQNVRNAMAQVVLAEGGADKALAQYRAAEAEVARLKEILSFLSFNGCVMGRWDNVRSFPPTNAENRWRDALTALETDPEAPLPK
jgi:hypothetical protein